MTQAFGIYVHWPYCVAKCPYCDFNSHVRERIDETRWAKAIGRELAFVADMQSGGARPRVTSVFFGGGTPSLMSGRATAQILETIAELWPVAEDVEITLEANPNSVEQGRFNDYRAAGINRVSIGVQALKDGALAALGRLHNAEEGRAAIRLAMATFPRVSFDLIYARPDHTSAEWQAELTQALAYGTEHLSLYQLTIEPGTAYATLARQGKIVLPEEDSAADLYGITQELCEQAGLPAYEISNHARGNAECRHNLLYWRYGDYAGVGPGAHGRLTRAGRRVASEAERLPERWLAKVEGEGHGLAFSEIDPTLAVREQLLMGLRLREGMDVSQSPIRNALDFSRVRFLSEQGLVTYDDNRLAATAKGRLVLNAVIAELAQSFAPVPPVHP